MLLLSTYIVIMRRIYLLILTLSLTGCISIPPGIEPVADFEINRYLGKWYEIARIENSFEKDMHHVTAEYLLREDGGVDVINQGYLGESKEPKVAKGKAYFVGPSDSGHLKVSFFGPFYGSYVIFELDHAQYNYSYVTSNDRDYLWFLSRSPVVTEKQKQEFISKVSTLGFDLENLIFVPQ